MRYTGSWRDCCHAFTSKIHFKGGSAATAAAAALSAAAIRRNPSLICCSCNPPKLTRRYGHGAPRATAPWSAQNSRPGTQATLCSTNAVAARSSKSAMAVQEGDRRRRGKGLMKVCDACAGVPRSIHPLLPAVTRSSPHPPRC